MQTSDIIPDHAHELRQAATSGDVDKVRTLLESGAKVDSFENAPLRWAVRHRQTAVVALLLESGATLAPYEDDMVLLAASNGDARTMALLFAQLPNPLDRDLLDRALVPAVKARDANTVNLLLDNGADPTAQNHEPLMQAACAGQIEILRLLITYGAQASARDSRVLFNAVFSRDTTVLQLLLAAGADVRAQYGVPLQLAINQGDGEMVDMLLQAEMPMPDPQWMVEAAQTDSPELLPILAAHGFDWTPHADDLVQKAAANGCARVLQYILTKLLIDRVVLSASLEPAVKSEAGLVVKLLIDHGADAATGQSAAFGEAIKLGQFATARWLLQAGARAADLPDDALSRTFAAGDASLTRDLLRHGVAVNSACFLPFTAWQFSLEFSPDELFVDTLGQRYSPAICRNRLQFCRALAESAKTYCEPDAPRLTLWLAHVLTASGH